MINNAGQLVEFISEAVKSHGATPHTEVRVRIGSLGPEYRIDQLVAVQDQRGFSLVLQAVITPETLG